MRYCIRNQPAPHAHVVAAPVAPPAPSAPAFSAPPSGGNGYNITTGAYGYGTGDGSYSGGPHDHGGHGDANYEAVPVGQSPGAGAEPLMAATIELCSRQAAKETVSPFRLRTGTTRMKGISVVLFPPFSVARNRVMVPLLMSCSFQPAVAAAAPAGISRGPRHSTAVVTTATLPIGVRSSSTAAVVVVIVRNRSCDTTAAATVQHCSRSSSMAPAPSVALAGSRGALAAMDRR